MRKTLILLLLTIAFIGCKHRSNRNQNSITSDEIIPLDTTNQDSTLFYKDSNNVFIYCEEMPAFPGGEKALMQYIINNTVYPQSAVDDSVEGRVILKFVIRENGFTDHVEILRGVRYDLDNECIKVISNMPKWKPGCFENKPVPVYFTIPIKFSIKKDESNRFQINPNETKKENYAINAKVFPNPAKDFLTIKFEELPINLDFKIITLSGLILKTGQLSDYEQQIEIHDLSDGIYILVIQLNGTIKYSQKFIVKK